MSAGCSSNVGFLSNGRNDLNLAKYASGATCFDLGVIMHEFLHGKSF